MVQEASATPAAEPSATSTRPSVTNWRTTRESDAPSARRTAISRRRLSDRTRIRLATLTLAITSRRPAPPSSTSRIGRTLPTITSERPTTVALWPRFESGYWSSSCLAIAFTFASPDSTDAPSARRATPYKLWHPRRESHGSDRVQRGPELGRARRREMELRRQHANDDVRGAVHDDALAEHIWRAAVALLPRVVAQNDRPRRLRQILAGVGNHDRGSASRRASERNRRSRAHPVLARRLPASSTTRRHPGRPTSEEKTVLSFFQSR